MQSHQTVTAISIEQIEQDCGRHQILADAIATAELPIKNMSTLMKEQEQILADMQKDLLTRKIETCQDPNLILKYKKERDACYTLHPNIQTSYTALDINALGLKADELKLIIATIRQRFDAQCQENISNVEAKKELEKNRLIQNPLELLQELSKAMLMAFNKFEQDFPANQSTIVRECLHQLEKKINTISKYNWGIHRNPERTPTVVRREYYNLYGLLAQLEQQVAPEIAEINKNYAISSASNQAFHDLIESLLLRISIHSSEKLFMDRAQCRFSYQQLINTPAYAQFTLSLQAFNKTELDNYNIAVDNFKKKLVILKYNVSENTYSQVENVFLEIQKALAPLTLENRQPLLKFFTKILRETDHIMTANLINKNNLLAQKDQNLMNYQTLMTHYQIGAPSICKKIFGAVMILLGALLIASSVTAKVTTLGIITPVSTGGIIAGTSLILLGAGLFNNGMRKGLSKALANVNAELDDDIKKQESEQLEHPHVAVAIMRDY